MGLVEHIDVDKQQLLVGFDASVEYDVADLDELTLAYAISTHRSQGSEFPVVILPLTTQHFVMLQRNLLYTAITRAKEMIVLVGTKQALGIAVQNNEVAERFTTLQQRLRGEVEEKVEVGQQLL